MSHGINRIAISGKVVGPPTFDSTGKNKAACSFVLRSERRTIDKVIAVRVRVNVYGDALVETCRVKAVPGAYVVVDGELMNRFAVHGELVEVRAHVAVFTFF